MRTLFNKALALAVLNLLIHPASQMKYNSFWGWCPTPDDQEIQATMPEDAFTFHIS